MSDLPETRASLLARARNPHDGVAWRQLTEVYQPIVYRYCLRRGLQDADAADLTQEVMRSVAHALRDFSYDAARGRFRNWLFTVTRSRLNNFFERRNRQELGSGQTTVHEMLAELPDRGEQDEWDRESRQQLFEWAAAQARSEFEPTTWRAFVMSAVEGRSAAEAAQVTGLSLNAVYVAKSRVLRTLRELIDSVAEEDLLV